MLVFLVTGVSGSGKSTVARALQRRGHHTVSTDSLSQLCAWRDRRGRRVDRPAEPDAAWLSVHGWSWDPARLDEVVAEAERRATTDVVWLCGDAVNALELVDRFDACFVLDIDQHTMSERIRDPRRGNDYGRVGDTLRAALRSHAGFVAAWQERGAVTIDATQDLNTVVDDLLTSAATTALHLR